MVWFERAKKTRADRKWLRWAMGGQGKSQGRQGKNNGHGRTRFRVAPRVEGLHGPWTMDANLPNQTRSIKGNYESAEMSCDVFYGHCLRSSSSGPTCRAACVRLCHRPELTRPLSVSAVSTCSRLFVLCRSFRTLQALLKHLRSSLSHDTTFDRLCLLYVALILPLLGFPLLIAE